MTSGVDSLLAALPHGLHTGSDLRGIIITTVQDYDTTSGRVLASVGGDPVWLLAVTGTYTAGDHVAVLRNPWTGRAEIVLGQVPDDALTAPPTTPTDPAYETVTSTVAATFTGTWDTATGRWEAGSQRLRQGSHGETGPLIGLATYGQRITDLRATRIDRIQVLARDVPDDGGIGRLVLAVAPHHARPAGAPLPGAHVASAPLPSGTTQWVDLDADSALLDAFRGGELGALALIGIGYRALRGRDMGGMTLRITYTRRA